MQDFLARLLLHPGELAFVENPTYDRTILTLRRPGSTVEGIPMEPDGLAVDVLETRLRQGARPVLLYTIPDFQNPMGARCSRVKNAAAWSSWPRPTTSGSSKTCPTAACATAAKTSRPSSTWRRSA